MMNDQVTQPRRRTRSEAKRETRLALLKAGLEEMVDRGLDSPSLDEICARAGYTRGAFYVHFKDREEFFVSVITWVMEGILEALRDVDTRTDLPTMVDRLISFVFMRDFPALGRFPVAIHRVMEAISRSPQLKTRFAQLFVDSVGCAGGLLEQAQQAGTVRKGLDPQRTASFMLAAGLGAMSLEDAGVRFNDKELKAQVLSLLAPCPEV